MSKSKSKSEPNGPRYPGIYVNLSEGDGNVYVLIGKVARALRLAGASAEELVEFKLEATAGDYDHALQVMMDWVEVE